MQAGGVKASTKHLGARLGQPAQAGHVTPVLPEVIESISQPARCSRFSEIGATF